MRTIRKRLSYANVVSTVALFLVLTGGAAYAASKLGHRSVGSAQLKSNAVTTAKIKANAVTTRKIKKIAISGDKLKEGAVTTEKLADGAVNEEKIDLDSVPFARIVARMRGTATEGNEPLAYSVYPLQPSTYVQGADELNSYAGSLGVTIPAKCLAPRVVSAKIVVGAENPAKPAETQIYASGMLNDGGTGTLKTELELSPRGERSVKFEPGVATTRNVNLIWEAACGGGGEGITATSGAVDVIGVR